MPGLVKFKYSHPVSHTHTHTHFLIQEKMISKKKEHHTQNMANNSYDDIRTNIKIVISCVFHLCYGKTEVIELSKNTFLRLSDFHLPEKE